MVILFSSNTPHVYVNETYKSLNAKKTKKMAGFTWKQFDSEIASTKKRHVTH